MTALAFALVVMLQGASPSQEPAPDPTAQENPAQEPPILPIVIPDPYPFIDPAGVEAGLFGGMLVFDDDFESDPQALGVLSLRAPLPWLSRSVLGLAPDALGVFLEAGASRIDRDLDALPGTSDGTVLVVAAGADLTLVSRRSWSLRVQAGACGLHFGDVEAVDSGAGFLGGVQAGLNLSDHLSLTLQPQALLAPDDQIYVLSAGVALRF